MVALFLAELVKSCKISTRSRQAHVREPATLVILSTRAEHLSGLAHGWAVGGALGSTWGNGWNKNSFQGTQKRWVSGY